MSINKQILVPIFVVALAGLIAVIWLGATVYRSEKQAHATIENALDTVIKANQLSQKIRSAESRLSIAISMVRLDNADNNRLQFHKDSRDIQKALETLQHRTRSGPLKQAISELLEKVNYWLRDAEIIIDGPSVLLVPTTEVMRRHIADINAKFANLERQAFVDASLQMRKSTKVITNNVAIAGLFMILLISVATFSAIHFARRISRAFSYMGETLRDLAGTNVDDSHNNDKTGIKEIWLALKQLKTSLKEKRAISERANRLAYFDSLTGLANRLSFIEFTKKTLRGYDNPVLIMVDLDNFKSINDRHGHGVGDVLLSATARRLEATVSEYGAFSARLGGDEFAIVVPDACDMLSPEIICEELLHELSQPISHENILVHPSASLGVAQAATISEKKLGLFMKSADAALYAAKSKGRNTFAVFDAAMALHAWRNLEIIEAIPRGLENGEFELRFQPQINLSDGSLFGFETLVRWRRHGKIMAPSEFIKIAEDSGLIGQIDLWVLRNATMQAAKWLRAGYGPLSISVNLSAMHFLSDDIVTDVQNALHESGLPANLLTLEITETGLLQDFKLTETLLKKLNRIGVEMSLDDFGTGYSSLAYLRTLDVNELKIDRSFLVDLCEHESNYCILEAIIDIARGLNLRVVIEGVETKAQLEIVQGFGVDMAQGYYFGVPMEEAKALETIQENAPRIAMTS